MRRRITSPIILCLALLGIGMPCSVAYAETYPSKPVKLVIPYSPGGIVDFAGRVLARKVGDLLGQTVVPENRAGAGGIAGTTAVANSAADGYTILIMDPAIVINPSIQEKISYDLFTQISPVSIVSSSPEVLVVSPTLPVKNLSELVAYAKAHPGELNFSSAGIGTTPHLAGELLKQQTGINAVHVPYRSIAESFPDLITGKVHFAFSSIAGALPFTTSNQVRILATTGSKRSNVYPNYPTVIESGLEHFEIDLWLGIFAPANLPPEIAQKLNTAIADALKDEQVRSSFEKTGIEARGTTLTNSRELLLSEFNRWKSVIKSAGIQ